MLKPIQLIRFDSKKNVQLTQQAIDIFTKLQSKQLCIVCVAGKYRTGKSYILNRVILQQNNGFQVGPTINACTKGLWMWPQIVKINCHGNVKQCLIIDTQGLGSLEQGENTDLKIFLLAMLLSSYLIYNSVGSIDQKALQSLNLVINMAQLLQKSNSYDSQQLINTFPQFLWLVRDFSLRLENQNGQVITSQQYLQTALSQKKGKTPVCKFAHLLQAAERKNAIRRQLKTFFRERDCFTLIRPTMNEKDLQNLSILSQKKLRPQFLTLIHELKQRIHQSIQPKKLRGKPLTPQGFIQLCQSYISSINSGKLPTISSSWDNLCMSESSRVIKKYEMKLREYVRERQMMMGSQQQVEVGQLTEIGEKLLVQAIQMIDRSFLGKLQKKLLKQKLQKTMKQTMGEIFNKKFSSIEQKVLKQLRQLFEGQQILLRQDENTDGQQDGQISIDNNNTNKRQFNIYYHVDSLRSKFIRVQHIINTTMTMDRQDSNNNKQQLLLIKRVYKQFMQHIEQKMLTDIQEQICNISEENRELKQKLLRMQQRNHSDIKQQKSVVMKLNKQLDERERLYKKQQMFNNKLKDQVNMLKEQNQTYIKEVKMLKQLLQKQLIQSNQKLSLQQQSYSNQLRQLQNENRQQQQQLQLINSNIKHEMHEIQIKQRKINRQCEIYKQKFIEKQKQVQCVNKQIEILKEQVMKLQREKRIMIVKKSMVNQMKRNVNCCDNQQQKQQQQQQQQKQKQQLKNQTQQQHQQNPQLTHLLTKLNLLQLINNNLQQQNKQTLLLYQQQQSINNILINTPKTINYQSLKKNYDEEKKLSNRLNKKIKMFENVMHFVNRLECAVCGELVKKSNMLMMGSNSNNICINSTSAHFIKCMASKIHDIQFDVSYVYDQQGELKFLFQIKMQGLLSGSNIKDDESINRNVLRESRRGGVQSYQQKEKKQISWQVTKSLKSIRLLLRLLNKGNKEILLFNDSNDDNNNEEIIKSSSTQHNSTQQRTINLNQQRRLYLDEECHKLKQQIKRNTLLIQFFSIDLHLLRESRLVQLKRGTALAMTTKSFSSSQSGTNSMTTLTNNNNNNNNLKRKKIGMLNLDLGEIIEQRNQNDNYNGINSSKRVLSQSLNFMKTTKFSMKKVFKFNNNV